MFAIEKKLKHILESLMIDFSSQNDFVFEDETKASQWLVAIAELEEFEIGELGYVFCSDSFLLDINIQYLDHDTYTDIVTFDYTEGRVLHGEMYISTDRIAENAREFGVSFDIELRRVMAHGLLHMCGYGDKTEADIKVMREKEDSCLELWYAKSY